MASNFVLRFVITEKHKHVFETSLKTFFKDIVRVYSLILNESEVIDILKNWGEYLPDVERSIINTYDLSLDSERKPPPLGGGWISLIIYVNNFFN